MNAPPILFSLVIKAHSIVEILLYQETQNLQQHFNVFLMTNAHTQPNQMKIHKSKLTFNALKVFKVQFQCF